MSNSCSAIDSHDLARITGGAITGPRSVREGAQRLDTLAPDSFNIGPFGWNLPEKPFTNMLDRFEAQRSAPQPSMGERIRQAAANSLG